MSFITSLLGSCIMILLLEVYSGNVKWFYSISYRFLFLVTAWILVRLILPFETIFTYTIPVENILPKITEFWHQRIYLVNDRYFCLYHLIIVIWAVGVVIKVIKIAQKYFRLLKVMHILPKNKQCKHSMPVSITAAIEQKYLDKIDIVQTDYVKSPVIFGVHKATILLPNLEFSQEELEFILLHELQHFKNHDLLLRILLEILVAIYWWNPFMFLLKKQITNLLEIRVDTKISQEWNSKKCLRYLELLLKLGRYQLGEFAVSFSGASSLVLKRAENIMNKKKRLPVSLAMLCSVIAVIFSFFIFEPYDLTAVYSEGAFGKEVFEEGYIIESNNEYMLYVQGEPIGTIENPFSEEFSNLPIYS